MDIIFNDGNKRKVPFDAEFAAKSIKKSWDGKNPGYRIRLNPENDRTTQLRQKESIEHYLSEFDRISGLQGKR